MSATNLTISQRASTKIKAKETHYAGCFFRSRLEARWAVFFDTLRIPWEYEPERYMIGHRWVECDCVGDCKCEPKQTPYLPDFFLPKTETWVEVKGDVDMFSKNLLADAVDWGHGLPGLTDSLNTQRGLLLLGPIPRPLRGWTPQHIILQHSRGGFVSGMCWGDSGEIVVPRTLDNEYFDSSADGLNDPGAWAPIKRQWSEVAHSYKRAMGVGLWDAYAAARSARFEGPV